MRHDYELTINNVPRLEVTVESPAWLPMRPHARRGWLRFWLASTLRRTFSRRAAAGR